MRSRLCLVMLIGGTAGLMLRRGLVRLVALRSGVVGLMVLRNRLVRLVIQMRGFGRAVLFGSRHLRLVLRSLL